MSPIPLFSFGSDTKAMMDTAQRTLLEVSYEAFHGAGFSARLPDGQLRGLMVSGSDGRFGKDVT